jgi:hypothetical protein
MVCKDEAKSLQEEIDQLKEDVAEAREKAGLPPAGEAEVPPHLGEGSMPPLSKEEIAQVEEISKLLGDASRAAQEASAKTFFSVDMAKKSFTAANNGVSMVQMMSAHPEARTIAEIHQMCVGPLSFSLLWCQDLSQLPPHGVTQKRHSRLVRRHRHLVHHLNGDWWRRSWRIWHDDGWEWLLGGEWSLR